MVGSKASSAKLFNESLKKVKTEFLDLDKPVELLKRGRKWAFITMPDEAKLRPEKAHSDRDHV